MKLESMMRNALVMEDITSRVSDYDVVVEEETYDVYAVYLEDGSKYEMRFERNEDDKYTGCSMIQKMY